MWFGIGFFFLFFFQGRYQHYFCFTTFIFVVMTTQKRPRFSIRFCIYFLWANLLRVVPVLLNQIATFLCKYSVPSKFLIWLIHSRKINRHKHFLHCNANIGEFPTCIHNKRYICTQIWNGYGIRCSAFIIMAVQLYNNFSHHNEKTWLDCIFQNWISCVKDWWIKTGAT